MMRKKTTNSFFNETKSKIPESRGLWLKEAKSILTEQKNNLRNLKIKQNIPYAVSFVISAGLALFLIKLVIDGIYECIDISKIENDINHEYRRHFCNGNADINTYVDDIDEERERDIYRGNNPYCSYLYDNYFEANKKKPIATIILGVIGAVVLIITSLVITCCYLGNESNDRELLFQLLTKPKLKRLLELSEALDIPISDLTRLDAALSRVNEVIDRIEHPSTPPSLQTLVLNYIEQNAEMISAVLPRNANLNTFTKASHLFSGSLQNNKHLNSDSSRKLIEKVKMFAKYESKYNDEIDRLRMKNKALKEQLKLASSGKEEIISSIKKIA